jgi:2-hydroxychromene-2-carboxylate isomerase
LPIPDSLRGIISLTISKGNIPPWKLPAKAKYSEYDRKQAVRYFGIPDFQAPSFFPILSLLVRLFFSVSLCRNLSRPILLFVILKQKKPQRAITYIKATYPPSRFEETFGLFWKWLFYQHHDLSKPEIFARLLQDDAGYSASEVQDILAAANDKKWKDALLARTQEALDRGAFGAPWLWVMREDSEGKEEESAMFFGSDR